MNEIQLLSIPNFYSSYYVLGLSKVYHVKFKAESEFKEFHNMGFVIFRIGGKLGVIDNHDPMGVNEKLYAKADLYFATNKLLNNPSYNQAKVRAIFPHYPVNITGLYLKLFGLNLLRYLKPKDLAREFYVLRSRPTYKQEEEKYFHSDYVFFAGSTWKKESWANKIRAEFIRTCKDHPKINFEGGFIPRTDGNNFGFDQELIQSKYPPKKFSELSSKSLVNLNNPAVLGAVSWRLAEHWNSSSFVLSFPFAIDIPVHPEDGLHIHYVSDSKEYAGVLDKTIDDPDYHKKVACGGKDYFDRYCTPESQAEYIVNTLLKS